MDPKEAQQARSKKYGIAVKDGGHVTKPGEWSNVPDDQFLDPVNYRYPCPDAEQTAHAASYWGQADNKTQYSTGEQSIMDKRLAMMEKKFKMGSMMNAAEWIPVMKTGTHIASDGTEHTFDEARLDRIISSYDPAHHEAPVVIGHPEENAPAWAWVDALKRVGQTLFYREKGAQPEFTDMRKRGLFKKRSLSLYPDGTLRHIGWLGAMPPAVKGLPDVAFSEQGAIFEFNELAHKGDKSKEGKKMKFFEWLRSKAKEEGVTLDDMPSTFSEADMKAAKEQAAKEAREKAEADFAEQKKKDQKEFSDREAALKNREAEGRKKGVTEFVESLKKAPVGKITPAMEKLGMGITNFMQQLALIETAVEFGEEGKKEKQTPLEFMQAFLSALPAQIEFKEVATADKDIPATGGAGAKLTAIVREKMKANKDLQFGAAFAEAQTENPDLAKEYAAELGI